MQCVGTGIKKKTWAYPGFAFVGLPLWKDAVSTHSFTHRAAVDRDGSLGPSPPPASCSQQEIPDQQGGSAPSIGANDKPLTSSLHNAQSYANEQNERDKQVARLFGPNLAYS